MQSELIFLVIPILLIIPVYHLLPVFICQTSKRLAAGKFKIKHQQGLNHALPGWAVRAFARLSARFSLRLARAGILDPRSQSVHTLAVLLAGPAAFSAGVMLGANIIQAILSGVVAISIGNAWISQRSKRRQRAFVLALYKIYRFLDLQITAGLSVHDALQGISEAVQDPVVQPVLLRFTAHYGLTLDFDAAFAEIRSAFGGNDSELLATHLRQCLQTGQAGRSFQRMEDLLFARFFSLMQASTQKIRFHLLVASLSGIFPCTILFMLPLLNEAFSAMNTVFG